MKTTAHAMQLLFQALAGEYRAPFNAECKVLKAGCPIKGSMNETWFYPLPHPCSWG